MNFTKPQPQLNQCFSNCPITKINGNNCCAKLPDGKEVRFQLDCIHNRDVGGLLKPGDLVNVTIPGTNNNANPNAIILGYNVEKLLPPTSSASANNIRGPNPDQFKNLQPFTSTSFGSPPQINPKKRKYGQYAKQNGEKEEESELENTNKKLKNLEGKMQKIEDNQKKILDNQDKILFMVGPLYNAYYNSRKKQFSTLTSTSTSTSTSTTSSSTQKPTDEVFSDEKIASVLKDLDEQKINFLAIDFDQTMVDIHTGGRWPGKAKDLATRLRPSFLKLIPMAIDRDFCVAVVTFSSQTRLIAEVLGIAFPEHIDRICIRGNDGTWRYDGTGSHDGKQAHMASAAEELKRRLIKANITRETTLLIDDDTDNIRIAKKERVRAVWFNPQKPNELVSNLGKVKKQT